MRVLIFFGIKLDPRLVAADVVLFCLVCVCECVLFVAMELLDHSQRSRSWAKIMCIICKRVIRNAVQLCCCGVRICISCIADTCPSTECNAPKPKVRSSPYGCSIMIFMFIFLKFFRDRAFEKDCMGKIVLCPLQCFWRGDVCLFQVCENTLICFEVANQ